MPLNTTTKRHGFSVRSLIFGALFLIAFVAAVFVDLAAVLQYFNVLNGNASATLLIGAMITAVTCIPLLLTGMSISADMNPRQ